MDVGTLAALRAGGFAHPDQPMHVCLFCMPTCLPVCLPAWIALRRSRAYQRFPELLLEHPDAAEKAFRSLLLSGIAVRDVDEWEEHHLTSVASLESMGGDGVGGGGKGAGGGVRERMLAGLGGQGCRLAEIDGSTVAIVEVCSISAVYGRVCSPFYIVV